MNSSQRWGSGLMILAALVVPGLVAYHLSVGATNPDLGLLAAVGIACLAGYALGQGASFLR